MPANQNTPEVPTQKQSGLTSAQRDEAQAILADLSPAQRQLLEGRLANLKIARVLAGQADVGVQMNPDEGLAAVKKKMVDLGQTKGQR